MCKLVLQVIHFKFLCAICLFKIFFPHNYSATLSLECSKPSLFSLVAIIKL